MYKMFRQEVPKKSLTEKIKDSINTLREHGLILGIRYLMIEALAGDIPVILNCNIVKPKKYKGDLIYFPNGNKPGICCFNKLYNLDKIAEDFECSFIISPTRDIPALEDIKKHTLK